MNRYISWEEYGMLIDILSRKINSDGSMGFDGVYGIPRGGLPVAVAVAHALCLPLLQKPTENTLIIDDISDNGHTLLEYEDHVVACLFTTPWTDRTPDYFADYKLNKNDWIVFPYENEGRSS